MQTYVLRDPWEHCVWVAFIESQNFFLILFIRHCMKRQSLQNWWKEKVRKSLKLNLKVLEINAKFRWSREMANRNLTWNLNSRAFVRLEMKVLKNILVKLGDDVQLCARLTFDLILIKMNSHSHVDSKLFLKCFIRYSNISNNYQIKISSWFSFRN